MYSPCMASPGHPKKMSSEDSLSLEQPTVTNKKRVVIAVFLTAMAILILGGSAYFIFRDEDKDKKEIGQAAGAGAEGSKEGGMTTSGASMTVNEDSVEPSTSQVEAGADAQAEADVDADAADNASTQANADSEAGAAVDVAQSQATDAATTEVTTDADAEKVETEVKASTSTTSSELQPATSTYLEAVTKKIKENRNFVSAGLMAGLALLINARAQNWVSKTVNLQ